MIHKLLITALSAGVLVGCVTAVPPEPAVLAYSPVSACTDEVSVASAVSLDTDVATGVLRQSVLLSSDSACVRTNADGKVPYAVFSMPTASNAVSINVGSVLEGVRTVPTRVFTLNKAQEIVREFSAEALKQRGKTLSVTFLPKKNEAFIVAAVRADDVGKSFKFITNDLTKISKPEHDGRRLTDEQYRDSFKVDYSYEGLILVRVYFSDPDI